MKLPEFTASLSASRATLMGHTKGKGSDVGYAYCEDVAPWDDPMAAAKLKRSVAESAVRPRPSSNAPTRCSFL